MRMTHALVQLAIALMNEPNGKHWGYQLSKASGVRSGVMYPLLTRLLLEDWLEDGWEEPTAGKKRPPRRYYTVTDHGRIQLGALIQRAQADQRFAAPLLFPGRPAIAGGYA